MKSVYQIRREFVNRNNEREQEVINSKTTKREIERSLNGLARGYKMLGHAVIWVREGYFLLPEYDAEYFICKVPQC